MANVILSFAIAHLAMRISNLQASEPYFRREPYLDNLSAAAASRHRCADDVESKSFEASFQGAFACRHD